MSKKKSKMGHNRIAGDQLKSIVERVENLIDEKQGITDSIKDVYAEAKGNGYDTKIIQEIVRIRAQDAAERSEHLALLETYANAMGIDPFG